MFHHCYTVDLNFIDNMHNALNDEKCMHMCVVRQGSKSFFFLSEHFLFDGLHFNFLFSKFVKSVSNTSHLWIRH